MERNTIPKILLDELPFADLAHDNYELAEDGYCSDTALLLRHNTPFAVLKTDKPGKDLVHTESLVLATLNTAAVHDPPPVELPTMIESQAIKLPHTGIYSYVPGTILSYPDMLALPNDNKVAIGRQLAEIVYWTEQYLSVDTVPELEKRQLIPSHIERLEYLRAMEKIKEVLLYKELDFYVHAMLDILDKADDQFDDAHLQSSLCGHNELLDTNITFDVQPHAVALRGIFDFGMADRRPTEFEFRAINFVSPYFTEGVLERYHELSGRELDADKIDTWSDVHVLVPLLYKAIRNIELTPRYAWYLEHFEQRLKKTRC